MRHLLSLFLLAGATMLGNTARAPAQKIWGGEYERALRPGVYIPYDGASYNFRYGYDIGPAFYPFGNGQNLAYLEYLDRQVRAEKFGYCPPKEPCLAPSPWVRPYVGVGFGWFRR